MGQLFGCLVLVNYLKIFQHFFALTQQRDNNSTLLLDNVLLLFLILSAIACFEELARNIILSQSEMAKYFILIIIHYKWKQKES